MTARIDRYRLITGVALVLPAFVFVTANILRYELGVAAPYNALAPVLSPSGAGEWVLGLVVILGPLAAFVAAATSIIRFALVRSGEELVVTMSLRWRPALFALAVVSALVLGTIGSYLVAENLPCILGLKPSC